MVARVQVGLPTCECKQTWTHDEGDGKYDLCDTAAPKEFSGCPTLVDLQAGAHLNFGRV